MKNNLTRYLICFTILLVPTYLIRLNIFGIPINVLEIFVLATFVFYLINKKYLFLEFYKSNKIILWSVLAIFIGLLTSTLLNDNWRAGFGIIKGWFIMPLIFSWTVYENLKTEEDLKSILKWLYTSVFLVALLILFYYFSGHLTYDGRLSGIYNSPNFLAMYLAPGVIIGVYLIQDILFQFKNKMLTRWRLLAYTSRHHPLLLFYIISFLIILFCLYFTYSYAAWAAVILSLIIVTLVKNKKISKRIILVGLIILLLVTISQWNSEKFSNLKNFTRSSLESRMIIWQSAIKILKNNWFWGIGPGNFQNKYLEYQKYFPPYLEWAAPQPHNLYLAFWFQSGILGLAGFIILIFKWLKNFIKIIRQQKNGADVAAVLLAIMIYILIHGLVDTPYWKNDLAMVFWVIFSLGLMMKKLDADAV